MIKSLFLVLSIFFFGINSAWGAEKRKRNDNSLRPAKKLCMDKSAEYGQLISETFDGPWPQDIICLFIPQCGSNFGRVCRAFHYYFQLFYQDENKKNKCRSWRDFPIYAYTLKCYNDTFIQYLWLARKLAQDLSIKVLCLASRPDEDWQIGRKPILNIDVWQINRLFSKLMKIDLLLPEQSNSKRSQDQKSLFRERYLGLIQSTIEYHLRYIELRTHLLIYQNQFKDILHYKGHYNKISNELKKMIKKAINFRDHLHSRQNAKDSNEYILGTYLTIFCPFTFSPVISAIKINGYDFPESNARSNTNQLFQVEIDKDSLSENDSFSVSIRNMIAAYNLRGYFQKKMKLTSTQELKKQFCSDQKSQRWSKIIELDPGLTSLELTEAARELHNAGMFADALKCYGKLIAEMLKSEAQAGKMQPSEEAFALLQELIGNSEASFKVKDFSAAADYFEMAFPEINKALDPQERIKRLKYGEEVHMKAGSKEKAASYLREYCKLSKLMSGGKRREAYITVRSYIMLASQGLALPEEQNEAVIAYSSLDVPERKDIETGSWNETEDARQKHLEIINELKNMYASFKKRKEEETEAEFLDWWNGDGGEDSSW